MATKRIEPGKWTHDLYLQDHLILTQDEVKEAATREYPEFGGFSVEVLDYTPRNNHSMEVLVVGQLGRSTPDLSPMIEAIRVADQQKRENQRQDQVRATTEIQAEVRQPFKYKVAAMAAALSFVAGFVLAWLL